MKNKLSKGKGVGKHKSFLHYLYFSTSIFMFIVSALVMGTDNGDHWILILISFGIACLLQYLSFGLPRFVFLKTEKKPQGPELREVKLKKLEDQKLDCLFILSVCIFFFFASVAECWKDFNFIWAGIAVVSIVAGIIAWLWYDSYSVEEEKIKRGISHD